MTTGIPKRCLAFLMTRRSRSVLLLPKIVREGVGWVNRHVEREGNPSETRSTTAFYWPKGQGSAKVVSASSFQPPVPTVDASRLGPRWRTPAWEAFGRGVAG